MDKQVAEKAVETDVETTQEAEHTTSLPSSEAVRQEDAEKKEKEISASAAPPTHFEQFSFNVQVETSMKKESQQKPAEKKYSVREMLSTKPQETDFHPDGVRANSYVQSFENITLGDIKKEREEKMLQEFKVEKEQLIKQQFEEKVVEESGARIQPKVAENQMTIEKPNFDLLEENSKIVKIKAKTKSKKCTKKKDRKKTAALVLACALGVSGVICVANCAALEEMYSSYVEMSETYKLNLQDYLKNINNLDSTKKGLEIIETYPDDLLDAGDVGQRSNWFDRLCNFIAGIFGG